MGKNRYDVKRGHFKNIEGDQLKELMEELFGDIEEEDDRLIVDDEGTIAHLEVWTEGRTGLWTDLEMNQDAEVDRHIFSLDDEYSGYLEEGAVADELMAAFDENGVSLSSDLEMSKQGGKWVIKDGNKIYSIREPNGELEVYRELAQENISTWNDFLERATGFTAKKRKKRAKKKAKDKK